MAWNKVEYERGVKDALNTAERTSLIDLIFQFTKLDDVGEYRVGWERGIRRILIDRGERSRCADFVLMTTANESLWRFVRRMIDAGKARWVNDPDNWGVVGLQADDQRGLDVLMAVYLEDGDFEESVRLLELMDEGSMG